MSFLKEAFKVFKDEAFKFIEDSSFEFFWLKAFKLQFFLTLKHWKARTHKLFHSVVLFLHKSALRWLEVFSA